MYIPLIPKKIKIKNLFLMAEQEVGRWTYFSSARRSIAFVYKLVSNLTGKRKALVPSYICEEALEGIPFFERVYYKVNSDFECELDDILTKLNKDIGMFLYVDYFGFQQSGIGKIASILREKGVYVVRDAAHCVFDPFKRNNEYNITDVEVYSLRKTYPVIGGGILKFNNFNLKFDEDLRVDGEWNLRDISRLFYQHLRFAFPSLFAGLAYLFNRYLRLQLKGKMCSGLIVESQGFSPCYYNYFLNIKKSEIASILQRRRTNYAYLAERLKSRCLQKMCFDALGVEDSPLGLPVRLDCASENCSRLRLKNIEAMQWTTRLPQGLDKKEFKQTFELANATVVLPIQQDLKRKHLDKILEEIGNL